jgi:hypothetical protein
MRHQGALLALLVAGADETRAQTSNQVYTAIEPCRIVDTRLTAPPSPLSPNVARAFAVVAGSSLLPQGGNAGGCGIPGYGGSPNPTHPRVQAVMMSFIAVGAAGAGNLRAWGSGPPPNASVLNYAAGTTVSNGVVVPLDQDSTPGADLLVRADVAATHLVIDVLGYFSERHPLAGQGRPGAFVWGTGTEPSIFELCPGPTGVSFGLSRDAVHAADAAAACEAGYWVCSAAERGTAACDTQREDTNCDVTCNEPCQDDRAANQHLGWLADHGPDYGLPTFLGSSEAGGGAFEHYDCAVLPVWCCTWW